MMTRRSIQLGVALIGFGVTWAAGVEAAPTVGGWYAVEGATGSVVEFTAGGDLTDAPRFATGVPYISSICIGPAYDMFAATPALNAVYRITEGGDFNGAMPFAFGMGAGDLGPAIALDCTGSRVLVSLDGSGAVFDVTQGGNFASADPFAWGFPGGAVDIFTDSQGTLWLSSQGVGIYDITAGGDFSSVEPTFTYDLGGPYGQGQIGEAGGRLYFLNVYPGEVWDFTDLTAGDTLSLATPFATGLTVATGIASDGTALFVDDACPGWNCGVGAIFDATAGGDLSVVEPFAGNHSLYTFFGEDLLYAHGCGDSIIWPNSGEECDEGGETATCNANCTLASCGDGTVNATNSEDCDEGDDNSDTVADACRSDCTLPICGDGVVDTGEECDDGDDNSDTAAGACRTDCVAPFCGDGVKDNDEGCDDGEDNSDTDPSACRTNCVLSTCGDGVKDSGEECDAGIYNSDTALNACRTNCTAARCGDGVLDSGEQCDDGNTTGEDGCSETCSWDYPGAGTGGSGSGGSGSGNTGTGNTAPNSSKSSEDDGGCSIRVAGGTSPCWPAWLALGLGAAIVRRRRSRRVA